MSEKKKILVVCFSDLSRDPRVDRQVKCLSENYNVTTISIVKSGHEALHYQISNLQNSASFKIIGAFLLLIRAYNIFQKKTYNFEDVFDKIKNNKYDLIIANDLNTLDFSVRLKNHFKSKLIFDAHEYFPEENNHKLLWRILFKNYNKYLLRKNVKYCEQMWSVSDGISRRYEKEYGKKVEIITNAPEENKIEPSLNHSEIINIIHHGNADKARHIETMIDTMKIIGNKYQLTLMLMAGNYKRKKYLRSLKNYAKSTKNIIFTEPVHKNEITSYINKFDIGLYILAPINFNHEYSLPNKIFEFIQAKLAVAIAPSIEMKKVVEQYDIGIVAKDFSAESMAEALNKISMADINRFKQNCVRASKELNAENNQKLILSKVAELIEN